MTAKGIPVFNTPGANANAVKELVVCSLLLASRGVMEGHIHVNDTINVEEGADYDKVQRHTTHARLACISLPISLPLAQRISYDGPNIALLPVR